MMVNKKLPFFSESILLPKREEIALYAKEEE